MLKKEDEPVRKSRMEEKALKKEDEPMRKSRMEEKALKKEDEPMRKSRMEELSEVLAEAEDMNVVDSNLFRLKSPLSVFFLNFVV